VKKAFFIMLREVRDFILDKGDLSFSILLPVVTFALIYGAFSGQLQFNGTAYVVNQDADGKFSSLLIDNLRSYKGLNVRLISSADADSRLSRSAILMAVFIPPDFSSKLAAGEQTQITFKERGNGGTEGQIVSSLVQGAAQSIAQQTQMLAELKTSPALAGTPSQQIQTVVQSLYAGEVSSPSVAIVDTTIGKQDDLINQFLPGIMTMYVLFAVNLTAQALVDERRKGTLDRLLTTRLKIRELFFGKFLAYVARGLLQITVLLALAYIVFRLFTPASFLAALFLGLIFAGACSAMGLTIGSISRTQGQATWISVFFTMLMVMLSGTFVPVSEGTLLGTLSRFSINTYANHAFGAVITRGESLAAVSSDILLMVGVMVAGLIIAGILFKSNQAGK
jgi:ABC-2 type transport system permease protein